MADIDKFDNLIEPDDQPASDQDPWTQDENDPSWHWLTDLTPRATAAGKDGALPREIILPPDPEAHNHHHNNGKHAQDNSANGNGLDGSLPLWQQAFDPQTVESTPQNRYALDRLPEAGLPAAGELLGTEALPEDELPLGAAEPAPFVIAEPETQTQPEDQDEAAALPAPQRKRLLREKRRRDQRDLTWNALTVIVWLSMACAMMAFVSVYFNPKSLLNPFRPVDPTLVSVMVLPTATVTPLPSSTPVLAVVDSTPALTPTQDPATATPTLEPTETVTPGPSLTPTIHSIYPFILRGDIKVIAGSTFPDHDTCKVWVAGQVYDLQGAPMTGVTVMLGGYLDGKTLTRLSLTGTALQYGPAGYEFTIADHPIKSKQSAWVMLYDQAMVPLSGKISFDTIDDCQQNLILINFRQVR